MANCCFIATCCSLIKKKEETVKLQEMKRIIELPVHFYVTVIAAFRLQFVICSIDDDQLLLMQFYFLSLHAARIFFNCHVLGKRKS